MAYHSPQIQVTDFKGLMTVGPNEGNFDELIKAENVYFDKTGSLLGRKGFKYLSRTPSDIVGTPTGQFVGLYREDTTGDFPTALVTVDGNLYGLADPTDTHLDELDSSGALASVGRGVQYGGAFYFSNGRKWDGSALTTVTDYPGNFGPMAVHNERVWCEANSRLFFSEVGDADTWPALNFIDVEPGVDDSILDIVPFKNRLFIFKERTAWILETPGATTSWTLRQWANYRAFQQTAIEYNGVLYWFGAGGVYQTDGITTSRISEPIQDVFDSVHALENVANPYTNSYSCVFDNQLIICVSLNGEQRIFCYNIGLSRWTEWTFSWQNGEGDPYPIRGLWAEEVNSQWTPRGVYMLVDDTPRFFIAGMFPEYPDSNVTHYDEYGVGAGSHAQFHPVIQTKFSDFGEPYGKKRVQQWMMEYDGSGMTIVQYDEEGRSFSHTVPAGGGNHSREIRFPGIGYARRFSMKITFNLPTTLGWGLSTLNGRLRVRGQQIKNAENTQNG